MKLIIKATILLSIIALPLPTLASIEQDFKKMHKAKYEQLMAMPYIKKAAECLGGWTVIDSSSILFKLAASHTEKLTNMIIEDGSISSVEAQHRMKAMQDFSRYFPDGVKDSDIARIHQNSEFARLMLNQCTFSTETGRLREASLKL